MAVSVCLIPDLGSWHFTAADSLHVENDVTTDTCVSLFCECDTLTQAMSVGLMVHDVISLSCYVSVF